MSTFITTRLSAVAAALKPLLRGPAVPLSHEGMNMGELSTCIAKQIAAEVRAPIVAEQRMQDSYGPEVGRPLLSAASRSGTWSGPVGRLSSLDYSYRLDQFQRVAPLYQPVLEEALAAELAKDGAELVGLKLHFRRLMVAGCMGGGGYRLVADVAVKFASSEPSA